MEVYSTKLQILGKKAFSLQLEYVVIDGDSSGGNMAYPSSNNIAHPSCVCNTNADEYNTIVMELLC